MRTFVIFCIVIGACTAQRSRDRNEVREEGKGPCQRPSGLFPHEEYCDVYYDCYKNDYRVVDCPNGLVFAGRRRGLTSNCDFPHKIDCGDRTRKNGPVGNDPCNYLYGIFEHKTSCTKYHTCWNGTATPQSCHKGLLWNQEKYACDWPHNVEGCQTHPLCADGYDRITDYPGDKKECFKFVQCIGGYPRVQKCAAGLAYSTAHKGCRFYTEVPECEEFFTTTTAPPDSDEDDEESGERTARPPSQRRRYRPAQTDQQGGPRRQQPGRA